MVTTTRTKDGDMTSASLAPVQHPFSLGGKARLLWMAARLSVDAGSVLTLLLLGWGVRWWAGGGGASVPGWTHWLAFGVLVALCWVIPRYLHWLAWAEVPGAYRTFTWRDEPRPAPFYLPEHIALVLHTAIWVAGGIWLATFSPALVGFFGGAFLAHFTYRLGHSIFRHYSGERWTRPGLVRLLILATVPLTWIAAGDGKQVMGGFWLLLMLLVIIDLARGVLGSMNHGPEIESVSLPRAVLVKQPLDGSDPISRRKRLGLDAMTGLWYGLGAAVLGTLIAGGATVTLFASCVAMVWVAWMALAPLARWMARPRWLWVKAEDSEQGNSEQ